MPKIEINSIVEYTVETFFFNLFSRKRRGIVTDIDGDMAKVSTKNSYYSKIVKWVNITDLKLLN